MRRALASIPWSPLGALAVLVVAPVAAAQPAPAPSASPASPPDKAACVRALDDAQRLRSQKRLTQARTELVTCASEACPVVVREDCARSLIEVDAAIPTVVLSATGAPGEDVTDAKVSIDGVVVQEKLDGRARALDPGTHVFRFERAGREPWSVTLLVLEGEKNRTIVAKLGDGSGAAPAGSGPAPSSSASPGPLALAPVPVPPEGRERAPIPVIPVVLAGVGAAALGSALYFRLRADGDADDLRATCAPTCDPSQRDALSEKLVIANVSLGLGVGALAAAAVTWVLSSRWSH